MITRLLFFNTLDFTIYVFGAFVFFSAGLLFLDSWKLNKLKKTPLIRSFGFFLLAIVYAIYASSVDIPTVLYIVQITKIFSLTLILASVVGEPILHKPKQKVAVAILPFSLVAFEISFVSMSIVLALVISFWYLWRSTKGLDKQLKPAAISFFFLFLAELTRMGFYWRDTTNVFWSKMLAEYAVVWNINIFLQFVAILILGWWVFGYTRFRTQIQLFTTILASILAIFLTTTVLFSLLLLRNLEADALSHLKTDANVFQYSLDRLQLESLAHARAIGGDSGFKEALATNNKGRLYEITSESLISQNLTSLITISPEGVVLMRAEDRDSFGNNLSRDPLVKSALTGQQISSLVLNTRSINPEVFIKSAVPVKNADNQILGVVMTGFVVDNAFVDGIKDVTMLDVTVFAQDKRTATTIISPDGKSRFVGTLETNQKVLSTVLEKGETFVGSSEVLNEPYYTAYTPLKTFGGENIGMLFIGKPQTELLETAQESIDLTFLGSIVLMVIAMVPTYFISKYIKRNVEA